MLVDEFGSARDPAAHRQRQLPDRRSTAQTIALPPALVKRVCPMLAIEDLDGSERQFGSTRCASISYFGANSRSATSEITITTQLPNTGSAIRQVQAAPFSQEISMQKTRESLLSDAATYGMTRQTRVVCIHIRRPGAARCAPRRLDRLLQRPAEDRSHPRAAPSLC